jgi:hypothetical protein
LFFVDFDYFGKKLYSQCDLIIVGKDVSDELEDEGSLADS